MTDDIDDANGARGADEPEASEHSDADAQHEADVPEATDVPEESAEPEASAEPGDEAQERVDADDASSLGADDAADVEDVDVDEADDAAAEDAAERDIATDVTATDREAAANEAAERARRVDGRRVGLHLTRAVAGVAVIALGALGIQHASGASIAATDPRTEVVVPASPAESRVCAGPLLRAGLDDGTADVISAVAEPQVVTAGEELEQTELPMAEVDDAAATLIDGTDLAGAETAEIDTDTARGFAASECSEPATVQWLVGGTTATGRSSILTIANPNEHNVSVDVRVFGEEGEIEAAGSTGIAIEAGTTVAIDVAGLAPALTSPVVQVVATGGPVSAHMQQSTVRGLVPGGIDIIDPVGAAATSVTIPGVRIEDGTGLTSTEGFADAAPALRVLSGEDATVTLTTIADGEEPVESTLELTGGVVSEIDLSTVEAGRYSFTLSSDVPIVAGVRQTVIEEDGAIDHDWVAAGVELPSSARFVVPEGPGARLSLVNVSDEEQTYLLDGQEVTLAPNSQQTARIDAGEHTLEGEGLVAAVSYVGAGSIAGFTISPRGPADDGLTVVL